MEGERGRVVVGFFFYPRGGSAHVTSALCRALALEGWDVTLVAGSLGGPGEQSHARTFFDGVDVRPVEYEDDLAGLHPPSFEEEAELAFPRAQDDAVERLVDAWADALADAGANTADVLHLHHLTPAHEAAARVCPDVPLVSHLHGTELAMLRWVGRGEWAERLRGWAEASEQVACLPAIAPDARRLLGLPPDALVPLQNGVDTELFVRRPLPREERLAFWRRWLVEDPRGWEPGGRPGSVAYTDDELAPVREANAVLLFVGRFLAVKRIPLLVRAHARAGVAAPLVVVGGFPGEWEGRHPLDVVRETGSRDVFLAGPRPHDALVDALNAADVLVFPSAGDSFGLPIVEAAACGVPTIAARAGGPGTIVRDGETGWLVPPDDERALTAAIREAVEDADERARRADRAWAQSAEWSWASVAARLGDVYDDVIREARVRA